MNINKTTLTLNKAGFPAGNKKTVPLYLFMLATLVMAAWGGSLSHQALNQKASRIFGINQPVATSFGSIIVSEADDLIGLTSQDLAGVAHGIQNLVLVDKTQIQLTVALLNRSSETIRYSPKQFTLLNPQDGEVILISNATIRDGELKPRSNIEATLGFVVPRNGASYILQYLDPVNDQTVQIDLGGVDVVSDEELEKLHH